MATVAPPVVALPVLEHVYLPGVSFATYKALLTEAGEQRNIRFTYNQGEMEIMAPSQDHEHAKKQLAQLIEVLTEELELPRVSCGSTTFNDQLLDCGLEPDECYYIQHEASVRGKIVELGIDPPPDLVIEVDVTTRVVRRLPIYAKLGFPEIWQYIRGNIVIHLLQGDGTYVVANESTALPMVTVKKLIEHLGRYGQTDETTWIRAFRQWVRDGMK